MSVPYQNPISSVQVSTPQSVSRTSVFGTNFSVLNVGGYMEVYKLSDLSLTLTASTYPSLIQLSANTIPIRFTKGNNTFLSPDYLTLNSDNISSGRRRLGMMVYVHETDLVYQYVIPNYDTLWNNLSGLTGFSAVTYSDYTTVINNRSSAGQIFINAWTASTIEGVSGFTSANANWRIFQLNPGGLFTGGTVTGPTIFLNGLSANTISATSVSALTYNGYIPANDSNVIHTTGNESFIGTKSSSQNITSLSATYSGTTNFIGAFQGTSTNGGVGYYANASGTGSSGVRIDTSALSGRSLWIFSSSNAKSIDIVHDSSGKIFDARDGFNVPKFEILNNGLANYGSDLSASFTDRSLVDVGYLTAYVNTNRFTGGTVSGATNFTSGLSANTISATTYYNLPDNVTGLYLPLSGGTVYGPTIFTSGVTANTLNVLGLTQTSGITSTAAITFPQRTISSVYTATTDDYLIDVSGGTFSVQLPSAVGIQGRLLVVKNNGGGAATVQPILGQTIDDKPYLILSETNSVQLASNGLNWIILGQDRSSVNNSTGVFQFSGLSIASSTTFNVAPVKGWIVDDTTNPLSPQILYIDYSGGVNTAIYVNTSTETWVYLTSGGTISQSSIELTEQQRRQNIFLGKLGHANKTNIINAFSQPDFVLSPLAQLRDMFVPINLINGGIYASANGVNLSFNTSAGYLYGLGINFANNTLTPNSLYVSGTSPCTFQYRTQTGGTASNTTFIDPTNYDVGGVITPISGTKASNQRIFLVQNGQFRVQYAQETYTTLAQAIEGIVTEQYNTFSNFTTNGILIGILSVLSSATNLSDTSKARFFFASKFGETVGSAGGVSTTNLQQAYNNSIQPEIITNTTLGAVTIKNGTGNADNITNLLESQNSSGTVTSFIRADGSISGNSLTLSSSASTINLDNPNQQQIRFFSGGTGTPQLTTYSQGVKIILRDNIDSSISTGYAIGVDAGSLWYGVDLQGNGHDWYAGTRKLGSLVSAAGFQLFGLGSPTSVAMSISGTSSLGSKGGTGYMDFLRVTNNWSAATNTNKWFRTNITGDLEILRSDYNATILTISDGGIMSVGGGNLATTSSSDGQTNYLSFGNNNTQIYDDGNTHIHSRGANQAMWINTNNGQINIGVQSPVAGGGIASAIAFGTGTVNGYLSINTGRTITTAANYGYLTTGGAGTYGGGSQSVVISLYANSRIWGQEIDAFSDERMKDIEGGITLEDGLKLVNNLKPIKYKWKEGDDKGIKAGYSAQQVIKSGFDHLVSIIPNEGLEETIDEDGFMSPKDTQFSMNYDQVTPYHGVVIKHLLEQIELLKEEIRELKNK